MLCPADSTSPPPPPWSGAKSFIVVIILLVHGLLTFMRRSLGVLSYSPFSFLHSYPCFIPHLLLARCLLESLLSSWVVTSTDPWGGKSLGHQTSLRSNLHSFNLLCFHSHIPLLLPHIVWNHFSKKKKPKAFRHSSPAFCCAAPPHFHRFSRCPLRLAPAECLIFQLLLIILYEP
ncbi:hypothetical protein B0O99DRAFT_344890 [Bisporella sp. PMI_857]|nr:hypothetical protein B0O99DRAFT_344890 [Bisporella sp. PMI_857]